MPEPREFPYPNFAFRVKIGTDDEKSFLAGFQEVSGLGAEVAVTEYRPGNSKDPYPMKVFGLGKAPDVTLKRGVSGAVNLFKWLNDIRDGKRDKDTFFRTVVIQLMAEDRTTKVLEWKLTNARPMKYTGPSLNGKSSDVAVEELVLSSENVTVTAD